MEWSPDLGGGGTALLAPVSVSLEKRRCGLRTTPLGCRKEAPSSPTIVGMKLIQKHWKNCKLDLNSAIGGGEATLLV